MIREKIEIGYIGNGGIQPIIDGANELDTRTYMSGITSNTIKEKVSEVKSKAKEISDIDEKSNQSRPDFSDLLDL